MSNPFITNDQLNLFITNQVVQSLYKSPGAIGPANHHCPPTAPMGGNSLQPILYYALGELLTKGINHL